MRMTPLHKDFGREVRDIDLRDVTAGDGYADIRDAFDRHSLLLFREQNLSDDEQMRFARLFGPIEDREDRPEPKMSNLSNIAEGGGTYDENDLKTLSLKANFLWHTDSTFLPIPALANVAQARVVVAEGGETEFVSTRAGWARLPESLRQQVRGKVFSHRFAHSRAQIDAELAKLPMITKWSDQHWRAVWPNPATGEEALYIASHAYAVSDMEAEAGTALLRDLIEAMTPPEAIYAHRWRVGDVLIWDERATLHRGRPWNYAEPRKLASVCVTARAVDGLEQVRLN